MPRPIATRVHVAPPVRAGLDEVTRRANSARRDVERARIVLAAAAGSSNAGIARVLGLTEKTVRKWRNRFAAHSVRMSLDDAKRSGRPASIPIEARCELIKIARDRPPEIALRDLWTQVSLSECLRRSTGWRISRSEIGRILRAEDFRPHRMRMWLHSPDPVFQEKVRTIFGLYTKPPVDANGYRALIAAFDIKTGRIASPFVPDDIIARRAERRGTCARRPCALGSPRRSWRRCRLARIVEKRPCRPKVRALGLLRIQDARNRERLVIAQRPTDLVCDCLEMPVNGRLCESLQPMIDVLGGCEVR